jgi:hypothetical protein
MHAHPNGQEGPTETEARQTPRTTTDPHRQAGSASHSVGPVLMAAQVQVQIRRQTRKAPQPVDDRRSPSGRRTFAN